MKNPENKDIFTVSRINAEVRQIIEGSFPLVWVEGEISGLARPRSGHMYFTLKDSDSQIRCALFRGVATRLRHTPQDGSQVLVRARLSLYEGRGEFQMIIEHLEPAGEGALRQAYDALKDKLGGQGLFDEKHKKTLPKYPQEIAIVTSAEGAAVRDVIHVVKRRYPLVNLTILPTLVQGMTAATSIIRQLRRANELKIADIILLTRGGGSFEDLNAFNDEQLALTIAESDIPVVTAIGHEIDYTIADFVSDLRAATPSAAAEILVPDQQDILLALSSQYKKMRVIFQSILNEKKHRLSETVSALEKFHPRTRITQQLLHLENLERRIENAIHKKYHQAQQHFSHLEIKLNTHSPKQRIEANRIKLSNICQRLEYAAETHLRQQQQHFTSLLTTFNAVNPLNTLERGYSIVSKQNNDAVTSVKQVETNEQLTIQVTDGKIQAKVI